MFSYFIVHCFQADKAIHERIRILALTRIVYGSTHWKLAEAHVSLAEDYLELKGKCVGGGVEGVGTKPEVVQDISS